MEIGKEELIQELLELVFTKAIKASKKTKIHGISKYLQEALDEKIDKRTLTRYYDGYILNKASERKTITEYYLDILSEYLGYENYKKFELNREAEIEKKVLRHEIININNKLNKIKRIGLCSSLALLVISLLFISKYYKKNCMIWVNDHYEKIRCSGLDNEKRLNKVVLKDFKKIYVCKDSTFFKEGKPIVHYTRHNNDTEFFTMDGEHPIYEGVYTDPITRTIIDSRVPPCDSTNSFNTLQ
ncbi:hypothetical protein Q4Q34_04555 [Flavivirga abyssicola]|uniref:hypothetical protein n=1 Tax=Flavivirga abyssicola TaxID=3063533 RepID=UPI0026E0B03E|nr:hypothetical protein [Flavivirga sp. MEBiC07777]WVK14299.1 hypothetical protein Q4Q34_04555 [Flavivirga sp. MEBiC07777]